MNDTLKIVFGFVLILIIAWGISGLVEGRGFFDPTFEIIDELGNTISLLIKFVIFGEIVWGLISLFGNKNSK